ncbi:FG-GAP repeat-containing protein [Roseomonas rosea]|uniref:FG-GAP repeat-containing protein n=1 Tax=Muricoccus roseus TaxID=198092 RepID=A0A1M6INK2_9PROT|nr:M10 family metallopeptidase C-terminal domain-containing protein [Roseomonas rosea]SHJ35987.1 FG-GAP repeat-containing protein [Roseomonas rosea]
MAQYPSLITLGALDGTTGLRLAGALAGDRAGSSVASAGDVNGDGLEDILIGALGANGGAGAAYIVFGRQGGPPADLSLATLDGTNGFRVDGGGGSLLAGSSVSSAGDINGDGFDDILIGAPGTLGQTGATYVIYGQAGPFDPSVNLASLDGTNGVRILGQPSSSAGQSVSSAGDVNGDGIDDFIIGAPDATWIGLPFGAVHVVFGTADGMPADLSLDSLDGTNGFRINGATPFSRTGASVSSAGDVNGDGFDDLLIGAPNGLGSDSGSGAAYVLFGRASGFTSDMLFSGLDGTNGFRIPGAAAGDRLGTSVASAGDVNGDGYDDIIVGRPVAQGGNPTAAYVVLGHAGSFLADLPPATLLGLNGFSISAPFSFDAAGTSVASAGDVNGDGFDDLLIGAPGPSGGFLLGSTYVVFGQAFSFPVVDLGTLDGTNGFRLGGEQPGDMAGLSVSSAGDVNGDGFDDLAVGANASSLGGAGSGAAYIIYGRAPDTAVNRSGTNADQTLAGGAFDDTLDGAGGADRLFGGAGNDTYFVDNAGDELREEAGAGGDVVWASTGWTLGAGQAVEVIRANAGASGITLTGNELANWLVSGAGEDVLAGGLGNDSFHVNDAGDQVIEAAGGGTDTVIAYVSYALASGQEIEVLRANPEAAGLMLTGNEFANRVIGADGIDILVGGLGQDTLTGGAGEDSFLFQSLADSLASASRDLISDFVSGEDRINLSALQAVEGAELDQAFTFLGTGGFTKQAGQLHQITAGSNTIVEGDVNGDARADFQILIKGHLTLQHADFVL